MDLIKYFEERPELNKSMVEKNAGIPVNSLHKHLKGRQALTPAKHLKLIMFLQNKYPENQLLS